MAYKSKIKKERVKTIIRTPREKIEGFVFLLPETRLLDLLNNDNELFIPVSKAKVFDESSGKLQYTSDFLAVNKSHVMLITELPTDDDDDDDDD